MKPKISVLLTDADLGPIGQGEGLGPWANIGDIATAKGFLTTILSNTISFLTIVAGLWFTFQLILGAYDFINAGAEAERVEKAKKRLSNAVIGLVVVVAAYALASLIGAILGLEILDPAQLIDTLNP